MPFAGGQPPGPHAGDMSPLTEALRPPIGLTADQCEAARKLRRGGWEIVDVGACNHRGSCSQTERIPARIR